MRGGDSSDPSRGPAEVQSDTWHLKWPTHQAGDETVPLPSWTNTFCQVIPHVHLTHTHTHTHSNKHTSATHKRKLTGRE